MIWQKLAEWYSSSFVLKFIYSEKATKFYEISTLLLSYVVPVKSEVEISQDFVAFSEFMNFTYFPDLLSVNFDTSWKIQEDRWLLFHSKVPDRTSSVSGFLYVGLACCISLQEQLFFPSFSLKYS